MIEIYNFNCTDPSLQKFSQDTLQIKSFPAYRLYPIGNKEKKAKSKIIFSKGKKLKEIGREISDLIDDPTVSLNPGSIASYMEDAISTKKPAVILFHSQDEINLSFRVIAQLEPYKNWISFANFKKPSEELKKQFSIDTLPRISVAFTTELDRDDLTVDEGIQTATYAGKWKYNELRYFFDNVITIASDLSEIMNYLWF